MTTAKKTNLELVKAARIVARAIDAHPLFGTEVDAVALLLEAFDGHPSAARGRAVLRELIQRRLLRREGCRGSYRYFTDRYGVVDDVPLGALVAAELMAEGRTEQFVDVLADTSPALALLGLYGTNARARLERLLSDAAAVRLGYLAGRARLIISH